ncbi:MAG TPA: hypothetical protein GX511_04715 [Firmicutes bacterium]|nr:hypothetical protein [Bacillota bacterium]
MQTWPRSGPENTAATVGAAVARAKELGIKRVVVASNTGETARRFHEQGLEVVCVTHQVGFRGPNVDEMPPETRKEFAAQGIKVLTTTHLLRGVGRGFMNAHQGFDVGRVVADTLYLFGQGTKVAVEVAVMALDAGLIPYGEDIIAVGGTGRGADTALVLRPAYSGEFLKTQIREIICKPWETGK